MALWTPRYIGAEPIRGNGDRENAPKPGRVVTVRSLCGSVMKRAVGRGEKTTAMDGMYSLLGPAARTRGTARRDSQPRVTEALKWGAWHTRNDLSDGGVRHRSAHHIRWRDCPPNGQLGCGP